MTTLSVLPTAIDLVIKRGDAIPLTLAALDKTGGPMNLTGCVVWFTLKSADDRASDDSGAVAQYVWQDGGSSSPQIVVADLESGVVALTLPSTLTATLLPVPAPPYRYDIQVRAADDEDDTTVVEGKLTVQADITISSSPP